MSYYGFEYEPDYRMTEEDWKKMKADQTKQSREDALAVLKAWDGGNGTKFDHFTINIALRNAGYDAITRMQMIQDKFGSPTERNK